MENTDLKTRLFELETDIESLQEQVYYRKNFKNILKAKRPFLCFLFN